MVFIIKIPNRGNGQVSPQPDADAMGSTDSQNDAGATAQAPMSEIDGQPAPADEATFSTAQDVQQAVAAADATAAHAIASVKAEDSQASSTNQASPPAPSIQEEDTAQTTSSGQYASDAQMNASSSSSQPSPAASLDVILSPPVVLHRYVRGRDKSMIVERPERIRAVLLGISAALGRLSADSSLGGIAGLKKEAIGRAPGDDTGDDLVAAMTRLGVAAEQAPIIRTLLCDRSIALDPPHPAVKFVHGHDNEIVEFLQSAHDRLHRKKRQAAEGSTTPPNESTAAKSEPTEEATDVKLGSGSHAEYVQRLARAAPHHAPPPRARGMRSLTSTPSKKATAGSSSDSDDEDSSGMRASEVPSKLNQGDLYLCGPDAAGADDMGGSGEAIRKALGACAEAVDRVVHAAARKGAAGLSSLPEIRAGQNGIDGDAQAPGPLPSPRAFLLTRPPGHHCTGNVPQGFCWVNNAVVAAAHAYLEHGIDRVAVLDIDLHHGNGTQALAWRINADTVQHDLRRDALIAETQRSPARASRGRGRKSDVGSSAPSHAAAAIPPRGLKIFYGSIHDIESYPCETGDEGMIAAASTCLEAAHGQWIWNVHLQTYQTEEEFYELYESRYRVLFEKAQAFFKQTGADPSRTLILISAGFDACVHEYPTMQRHGKHVPVSFYYRFAQDTVRLAAEWSEGKIISLLEGGYSDRALSSAAMAHIAGLSVDASMDKVQAWWQVPELAVIEKAGKKVPAAAATATSAGLGASTSGRHKKDTSPAWLQSAMQTFTALEATLPRPEGAPAAHAARTGSEDASSAAAPGGRSLRDRTAIRRVASKAALSSSASASTTPEGIKTAGRKGRAGGSKTHATTTPVAGDKGSAGAAKHAPLPPLPASEQPQRTWHDLAQDSPLGTPTPLPHAELAPEGLRSGAPAEPASVLQTVLQAAASTGGASPVKAEPSAEPRPSTPSLPTPQEQARAADEALALQLDSMSLFQQQPANLQANQPQGSAPPPQ